MTEPALNGSSVGSHSAPEFPEDRGNDCPGGDIDHPVAQGCCAVGPEALHILICGSHHRNGDDGAYPFWFAR
jgi:hypothetical protein